MSGDRTPTVGKVRVDLDRKLVAVARKILEHDGLEALTLRAAARAAGVSHMAPYRHFESKDELLAAVAEEGFVDLARAMDGKANKAAMDHQDRLQSLGRAYVTFAMSNPALYRLMFGANLANRARFPGLVAAGNAALQRCVDVIDPVPQSTDAKACASRKAIAYWAFVHGLACLGIDDLIKLPPLDDGTFAGEIDDLLQAARFSVG